MENKDDDQATEHGSFNQGMYLEFLCSDVCGISLRSGQLVIELFPDLQSHAFRKFLLRRRGGDCKSTVLYFLIESSSESPCLPCLFVVGISLMYSKLMNVCLFVCLWD